MPSFRSEPLRGPMQNEIIVKQDAMKSVRNKIQDKLDEDEAITEWDRDVRGSSFKTLPAINHQPMRNGIDLCSPPVLFSIRI